MANQCAKGIVKTITSDCSTQQTAGIEQVIYLMNRKDVVPVFETATGGEKTNKITSLSLSGTAKAYKLIGQKQNLVCGFDRVTSDTRGDMFTHFLSFNAYEFDTASADNINEMEDIVAIVERKAKDNADGCFMVYGLGTGLYYTSDSYRSNENDGVRMLEMQTQSSQPEKVPYNTLVSTDYAGTKTLLEGLC